MEDLVPESSSLTDDDVRALFYIGAGVGATLVISYATGKTVVFLYATGRFIARQAVSLAALAVLVAACKTAMLEDSRFSRPALGLAAGSAATVVFRAQRGLLRAQRRHDQWKKEREEKGPVKERLRVWGLTVGLPVSAALLVTSAVVAVRVWSRR